jgi:hypothetical protein
MNDLYGLSSFIQLFLDNVQIQSTSTWTRWMEGVSLQFERRHTPTVSNLNRQCVEDQRCSDGDELDRCQYRQAPPFDEVAVSHYSFVHSNQARIRTSKNPKGTQNKIATTTLQQKRSTRFCVDTKPD